MVEGGPESASGIIPAYAGNTSHRHERGNCCRDHPRVCGEHVLGVLATSYGIGSSPRMRGTRAPERHGTRWTGIIPAYAGNTRCQGNNGLPNRDHPRVCGEHPSADSSPPASEGSSPRMRGTPPTREEKRHENGIIPAYAGNTRPLTYATARLRDHPRVCGEHCVGVVVFVGFSGSSPRMRGTHERHHRSSDALWIIPAYAGNTLRD